VPHGHLEAVTYLDAFEAVGTGYVYGLWQIVCCPTVGLLHYLP
jgi:hypothetical protein